MKRIDTTQETATSWSPFKVESKAFMQDANKEMVQALCQNLISNYGLAYSPTVPYYIGQYNNLIFASDGVVFFNGELYIMKSNSGLTYAVIDTTSNAIADPTTFSDNTTHNIHKDRYLTFTNTLSGSLFPVANIISIYPTVTNITLLNSWLVYSSQTPAYLKVNSNVFFQGSITKTGLNTGTIFTLPVNVRPSIDRHVICVDAQAYTLNVLSISASTGNVSLIVSSSSSLIFLDGISYAL